MAAGLRAAPRPGRGPRRGGRGRQVPPDGGAAGGGPPRAGGGGREGRRGARGPRPGPGRRAGWAGKGRLKPGWFSGLWKAPMPGLKDWLQRDGVQIEEARLFWPGQMLHLRRLGASTWWSAVWEGAADAAPGWLKALTERKAEALKG